MVYRSTKTLVHEVTHRRYGIGGGQKEEVICEIQAYKAEHNIGLNEKLTSSEIKCIIRQVKRNYPSEGWKA